MDRAKHSMRGAARNILSNWATFVVSAGVNFFLSPFVVKHLGATQYGAWVLLGALVGNLGLLDIGIRVAVQRYIAGFHTSSEHERATRLYSSALSIFLLAGAVATVLSVVMSFLIGRVFNVPPELVHVARVVMILGGLNVAASLIGGVFGGVLCGLERFDFNNAIEMAATALRAILVVVVVTTNQGLIGLALVQLVATVVKFPPSIRGIRRLYPQLALLAWTWDAASVRLLLTYGLTASLLHVSYAIMFYSDSLIIGAYLPIALITYFAIASNLIDYARSVMSGITQTLSPRLSALQAAGHDSALSDATLMNARMSTLVVAPIAATFLVTGSQFIGLWMGPKYADLSGQVLRLLTLPLIVLAGYQVVSAAMFGVGKHARLIPMFVGEAVCNIGLSVVWVRSYGVLGTALGTVVPRMIVSTLIGPWYAKRALGVPLSTFLQWVFVLPILAMIPFAVASYVVERTWPATNVVVYFAHVVALMPLAAVSAWFVCLTRDERAAIRRQFGRVGPRSGRTESPRPVLSETSMAPGKAD